MQLCIYTSMGEIHEEKSSADKVRGHCPSNFQGSRFSIDDVCFCWCDKVWEILSQLFSPLTESALERFSTSRRSMTRPKTETDWTENWLFNSLKYLPLRNRPPIMQPAKKLVDRLRNNEKATELGKPAASLSFFWWQKPSGPCMNHVQALRNTDLQEQKKFTPEVALLWLTYLLVW